MLSRPPCPTTQPCAQSPCLRISTGRCRLRKSVELLRVIPEWSSSTSHRQIPKATTTSRDRVESVSDLDLRAEPYDGPAAQQLTEEVQQEYVARYGEPDATPVHASEFAPPDGRFLVGYLDTTAVAMGGVRRIDADTVEIKRMYVVPACRGRGLSRVMLARLESLARELGASR